MVPGYVCCLSAGKAHVAFVCLTGPLGLLGRNGWFTREELLETWPELAGWRGLKCNQAANALDRELIAHFESWGGTTKILKYLQLPFGARFLNDTAEAFIRGKLEARAPLLFYLWDPHPFVSRYRLNRLTLPMFTTTEAFQLGQSDFAPGDVVEKVLSTGLTALAPLVAKMYARFNLNNAAQSEIMSRITFDGHSVFSASCAWMKDSQNVEQVMGWTTNPSSSNATFTRGGALDLGQGTTVAILDSHFCDNEARDGVLRAYGGAIFAGAMSTVDIIGGSFVNNVAAGGAQLSGGGAMRVESESVIYLEDVSFEKNIVNADSDGFGGAIDVAGSLTLGSGNIFTRNRVAGRSKSAGGALSVRPGATVLSRDGAEFIGNTVRSNFLCTVAPYKPHSTCRLTVRILSEGR